MIGAALWVGAWTSIGYLSGSHINTIYSTATRYSTYLAIALGAVLLAYMSDTWSGSAVLGHPGHVTR